MGDFVKSRLLREFIRASIQDAHGKSYSSHKQITENRRKKLLREFNIGGVSVALDKLPIPDNVKQDIGSYKSELDSFLKKNESKIIAATDYYQNLIGSGAGIPIMKDLLKEAAQIDLKYSETDARFPAATAALIFKVTQSWDNALSVIYSYVSPALKSAGSWLTSWFYESIERDYGHILLNEATADAVAAAVGAAISDSPRTTDRDRTADDISGADADDSPPSSSSSDDNLSWLSGLQGVLVAHDLAYLKDTITDKDDPDSSQNKLAAKKMARIVDRHRTELTTLGFHPDEANYIIKGYLGKHTDEDADSPIARSVARKTESLIASKAHAKERELIQKGVSRSVAKGKAKKWATERVAAGLARGGSKFTSALGGSALTGILDLTLGTGSATLGAFGVDALLGASAGVAGAEGAAVLGAAGATGAAGAASMATGVGEVALVVVAAILYMIAYATAFAFVLNSFIDMIVTPAMEKSADFKPIAQIKDMLNDKSDEHMSEIADWFESTDPEVTSALRSIASGIKNENVLSSDLQKLINATAG
jgi:hypothetical protein